MSLYEMQRAAAAGRIHCCKVSIHPSYLLNKTTYLFPRCVYVILVMFFCVDLHFLNVKSV